MAAAVVKLNICAPSLSAAMEEAEKYDLVLTICPPPRSPPLPFSLVSHNVASEPWRRPPPVRPIATQCCRRRHFASLSSGAASPLSPSR